MLLQNSTFFNNLTQGWGTCGLQSQKMPSLHTRTEDFFFFLKITKVLGLKVRNVRLITSEDLFF